MKVGISGRGGQGVIAAGRILAQALFRSGHEVTLVPFHSAEVRGSQVGCRLIISESPILAPVPETVDWMLVLGGDTPDWLETQGQVLLNAGFAQGPEGAWPIPAGRIAVDLGDERVANLVLIGALSSATGLLDERNLVLALKSQFTQSRWVQLNLQAFRAGAEAFHALKPTPADP